MRELNACKITRHHILCVKILDFQKHLGCTKAGCRQRQVADKGVAAEMFDDLMK